MPFTLFDTHVQAHEKVGTINYGQTTSSTDVNSIEDQTESSAHADDQFNGGTLYITQTGSTVTTASWAQGKFARILDYDASSGQYIVSTQGFTTASTGASSGLIPAGTIYGVATPEFNLQLMNRLANAALRTLGTLVYADRSLQSSANQEVYALTTLATRGRPFRIDIEGQTGSSADRPDWTELHGWYIEPSAAGSGHNVVFPRSLPSGRDIRIFYEIDHPAVTDSTQVIDGRIHPELATLALVEKMYEYRNSRARGAQDFDIQRWNDAKRQLAEARIRWPIWRPKKKPQVIHIGQTYDDAIIHAPPYGSLE